MATPDYINQVILSTKARAASRERLQVTGMKGIFARRSVAGMFWAVLDVLTITLAAIIAQTFRVDAPHSDTHLSVHGVLVTAPAGLTLYLIWFSICFVFLARSNGLYLPIEKMSGLHELRLTVQSSLMSGLLLCGLLYLTRGLQVSRIVVLISVPLSCLLLCTRRVLWRLVVYQRHRDGVETRNVLIVGSGLIGHALRNHLDSLRHLGFRFKGYVAGSEIEMKKGGQDVVGDMSNCITLARALFVDEIFLSVPYERKQVITMVEEARAAGIDVRVVPDLYDGLAWNAPIEYIGQFPTIPLHRREMPVGSYMTKRLLDLSIAILSLILASPLMVLMAIAIQIDSPGPVLYRSRRIGRKGRTFVCYKFRTMVKGAEKMQADFEHMNEREGVLFKISNDPRITRLGRFIRKYSLDELPQFVNVLLGDMSIVGPRPPLASEVEQYDLTHLRRLDVLPGITGLWQVEARQDPSFDSYISLDTAYVENWSLWLDLKILVRTVNVVFGGTGS